MEGARVEDCMLNVPMERHRKKSSDRQREQPAVCMS